MWFLRQCSNQRIVVLKKMDSTLKSYHYWCNCNANEVCQNISFLTYSFVVLAHVYRWILVRNQFKFKLNSLIAARFTQKYYSVKTKDSKIADGDALLVLENLKVKGYQTGSLLEGHNKRNTFKILEVGRRTIQLCSLFDQLMSKKYFSILQSVAKFHALPIALRLLRKSVFDTHVKPYLKPIDLYLHFDQDNVITKVSKFDFHLSDSICSSFRLFRRVYATAWIASNTLTKDCDQKWLNNWWSAVNGAKMVQFRMIHRTRP